MRLFICAACAVAFTLLSGCSGSASPKAAVTVPPTVPPAQTSVIRTTTPDSPAVFATPQPQPAEVTAIIDQVRLKITELPREYSYGPFAASQPNEFAVQGYDDPAGVLDRMRQTGRLGGFVQSLTNSEGPGGAFTIEVWKDAAGATAYFDHYPRPDKSSIYQEISLSQPLGEQSFVYQYQANGQTGYSLAWRRGRIILGMGMQYFPGKESLDKVTALAMMLDQKAQAARQ